MFRFAVISVLLCALALPASAGVTIVLKNGHQIVADEVVEQRDRVQYTINGAQYAIPKSLVDHIERPGATASAAGPVPVAPLPTTGMPAANAAAPAGVINGDTVDDAALARLERAGNAVATAAGFFAAGRFQFERGNRDRALFYFERALSFAPENVTILVHYAATLVQLGRASDAIPFAEHATRLDPDSADAFTVLGFAYYGASGDGHAIAAWKRALALRPDATLQTYLAKAEREEKAESDFRAAETGHFVLRFEGASTADALRNDIQRELESDYADLVHVLGAAPRAAIPVSLYTNQAFFDVTQAPAWSGAINDGRIRIPVQGLTEVTPEFRRVLRHELTHSFINQMVGSRCPQWLNEGIAQLMEPRTLGPARGAHLARLFAQGAEIPLNRLEVSFLNFSPFDAVLAYDESLGATEYIRDTFGTGALLQVLRNIGEGSSTETALRITVHAGYAEMERAIGRFLMAKYAP